MSEADEQSSYEAVLDALRPGDIVSFNNSGGANATGTPELEVVAPGPDAFLQGSQHDYEVHDRPDGGLELWYGEKDSASAPDRHFDPIETIEVIAEGGK